MPKSYLLILGAIVAAVVPMRGQSPLRGVTAADYARAETFLAPAVTGLVVGGNVAANWLSRDRFWYRTVLADGSTQTILVDPDRKTRTLCTSAIADCPSPSARDTAAATQGRGGRGGASANEPRAARSSDGKPLATSPDGNRGAFVRDWNLWVRDMRTGQEKALTTDGARYFGYATDNAGWSSSDRAMLLWSPDSTKIATQQQDERDVVEMYLVNTTPGHPALRVSKFPLPDSGGGFATTAAMFRFPDFFKVGIAESGNHDQRENEGDWGERYHGLVVKNADGTDSYDAEANQNFANNLKGGLLLAHGTMDTNVPPYQTMLVADALIKANKDFDLLMIPNANHGYGAASNYMMRRRWDYFVRWLIGIDPPKEYRIGGDAVRPPVVSWQLQTSGVTGRLRGVSAVSPTVAWASGAAGTVLRTTDGGDHWQLRAIPGAETLDFRDVDAMSEQVAYALSIGAGAASRIYKTNDGGTHWDLQFANTDPKVFLDAMAFWDADRGIAFSDSVDGRFVILTTGNGGRSWERVPADRLPPALPGEGAFAASGTNVALFGREQAWIGTTASRVLRSSDGGRSWTVAATPLATGQATGIFSIAFRDAQHGIVVGGDYRKESEAVDNAAVTSDGGATWSLVRDRGPSGFRSVVAWLPRITGAAIALGPSGADWSSDEGRTWTRLDAAGFDTLSVAPGGTLAWATGQGGRISKVTLR